MARRGLTLDTKVDNSRPCSPSASADSRLVRTIPPWIQVSNRQNRNHPGTTQPPRPDTAVPSHHHYLPVPPVDKPRGRRWDAYRNAEPAMIDMPMEENQARWTSFMRSGPQYDPHDSTTARYVSDEWFEDNMPGWTVGEDFETKPLNEKHKSWLRRGSVTGAKRTLLKNPFIPLVFRMIVITFTLAAMGLGARLWHQTRRASMLSPDVGCNQRPSTYMAIILDCIAVPYILYVTWDEYTSKPLGLRSATAKTSLLLTDLYFVVFYSSNLTLAFSSLTDNRWACFSSENNTCPQSDAICHSQSGLVAVLFVALVAWLITFSISVLRVVKRLRPDE